MKRGHPSLLHLWLPRSPLPPPGAQRSNHPTGVWSQDRNTAETGLLLKTRPSAAVQDDAQNTKRSEFTAEVAAATNCLTVTQHDVEPAQRPRQQCPVRRRGAGWNNQQASTYFSSGWKTTPITQQQASCLFLDTNTSCLST